MIIIKTRQFNGETFYFSGFATTKRAAEKDANELRHAGKKARIVPDIFKELKGYSVFYR